VADAREGFAGDGSRVHAENGGGAGGCAENIHQNLDQSGFAGAVWADKRVDTALGDAEAQFIEGLYAAEALGEGFCFDGAVHRRRACTIASATIGTRANIGRGAGELQAKCRAPLRDRARSRSGGGKQANYGLTLVPRDKRYIIDMA